MTPGEIIVATGDIILNEGREAITLTVANTGDSPYKLAVTIILLRPIRRLILIVRLRVECDLILRRNSRSI